MNAWAYSMLSWMAALVLWILSLALTWLACREDGAEEGE